MELNQTQAHKTAAFEWLRYLPSRVGEPIGQRDAFQADVALRAWAAEAEDTEWRQPRWQSRSTHPEDGRRTWLYHEKFGVTWGFIYTMPGGATRCELYKDLAGTWCVFSSGAKAARGVLYWMPAAPSVPEPPEGV